MSSFLFDSPLIQNLYEETRAEYMAQVEGLCEIDLSSLPEYYALERGGFEALFRTHMHRYQQAFLFLREFDLLGTAITTMVMRSMSLPGKDFSGEDLKVATLTHHNQSMSIQYDRCDLELEPVHHPEIVTRAVVPLLSQDKMPYADGNRILTTSHPDTETILFQMYPEQRLVVLVWSDLVLEVLPNTPQHLVN